MDSYAISRDYKHAQIYGEKILNNISKLKPNYSELREDDSDSLKSIENQTMEFLQRINIPSQQNKNLSLGTKEPGRNEIVNVQYNDGKQIKIKYKKVISDIKNGKCKLIK
jgi:hypothetical protein